MRLATWNLNNRVGKIRFKPEAATAAAALDADVLVLTEYFPQTHFHSDFCEAFAARGWNHQFLSQKTDEKANRVLILSRLPLEPDSIAQPSFDEQFPANLATVRFPQTGLRLIGIRIPGYNSHERLKLVASWNWLEKTAHALCGDFAVIAGDLNISTASPASKCGDHFRRILESGWKRAAPADGHSFLGHHGSRSEIDHILATTQGRLTEPRYVTTAGGVEYAGSSTAISDHAALVAEIEPIIQPPPKNPMG